MFGARNDLPRGIITITCEVFEGEGGGGGKGKGREGRGQRVES